MVFLVVGSTLLIHKLSRGARAQKFGRLCITVPCYCAYQLARQVLCQRFSAGVPHLVQSGAVQNARPQRSNLDGKCRY
jgi:hypothetical protein